MTAPRAHQVQFFDVDDDRGTNVSSFVAVPLLRGEAAVVVATAEHRAEISARLVDAGVDLAAARGDGRYVELDAAQTLLSFMTGAGPAPERFRSRITDVLAQLSQRFGAVSAYGEMVGLLAADGHLVAALQLERLWTAALDQLPLRLLCGYPAEFAAEQQVDRASVCAAHDVVAPPVTSSAAVDLPLGPAAAAVARWTVDDICRAWGFVGDEDWSDDVELVVAELVGNAVRHAGSRLALSLDAQGGTVTVAVTDGSTVAPVPRRGPEYAEDGRGLLIVEALSDRWGVEHRPGGKTVWAQLRPFRAEALSRV